MIYSPAIGKEGIIYTLDTWGNIVAFNPDGSRRWETSVRPREWGGVPAIPTGDFALGADETLYAVVYQLFHNTTTGVFSAIRADGSLKWTINADSSSGFTGASLDTDGYIYVVSVKRGTFGGTIPGDSSKVIALNPDGTLKWEYKLNETGGEWWSSPVIGLNKTMYITTGSGKLYALR